MNIEWIKKRSQTSPPRSVVKLFCARAPRNRHINGLRPGGEEFSNGSRSEILPPFTVCMPFRSNLTSVSLTLPPLPLDLVTTIRSSTGTSRIFATFLHRMRHEHLSLSLSGGGGTRSNVTIAKTGPDTRDSLARTEQKQGCWDETCKPLIHHYFWNRLFSLSLSFSLSASKGTSCLTSKRYFLNLLYFHAIIIIPLCLLAIQERSSSLISINNKISDTFAIFRFRIETWLPF